MFLNSFSVTRGACSGSGLAWARTDTTPSRHTSAARGPEHRAPPCEFHAPASSNTRLAVTVRGALPEASGDS
jgi:hypothetical protein